MSTKPPVSTKPTLQNPLLLRFIITVIIKNHRWWDLTIVTQPHRSCKHWYSFGWKPDDGRNRPKHVVFYHPLINIIRYTCVIDLIPPPIKLDYRMFNYWKKKGFIRRPTLQPTKFPNFQHGGAIPALPMYLYGVYIDNFTSTCHNLGLRH